MIKINKLDKSFIENNLNQFLAVLKDQELEYWREEHFLLDLEEKWKYSLVLLKNELVIGYLIASRKDSNIHIHKLMLDQKYRSQGYGKWLLENLEFNCKKNDLPIITLKVHNLNSKAIKFYTRYGFRKLSVDDRLIMMSKRIVNDKK